MLNKVAKGTALFLGLSLFVGVAYVYIGDVALLLCALGWFIPGMVSTNG